MRPVLLNSGLSVFFALTAMLLLANPATAVIHEINIGNFFFSPTKTTVAPGDTVRWTMVSGISHTTTSEVSSPKSWDSDLMVVDDVYDVVFTEGDGPGPFPYLCSVHPFSMKDTIFMSIPAEPTLFEFIIKASEAGACVGTGSPATGAATATLSGDSTVLNLHIEHNVANPIDAHVHLGDKCVNGAVRFGFSSPISPIDADWAIAPADVASLFAGDLYVNIHSIEFPAGEIRGQIENNLFACGDANGDGGVNLGDAGFVINYVFFDGSAPDPLEAGDANADGSVNLGDAGYVINFIFYDGPGPVCP